jgi:acyl-CoA synthetase (AMP-forming)/AMP-acid ligase II
VCRSFDVEQVLDLVHRGAVALLSGVPTMFIEMQRHPRFDAVDFSRLKLVISGGAPCPLPVFERFVARDLAQRDAEGCFRSVGRVKELISSGGENIYPSEVESVLAGHPEVAEVCVIGIPAPRWGETPRALVVRRPGSALASEALLAWCDGRLARYVSPRSTRFLDALPRTAAGKVDRRELASLHGAPRGE